MTNDEKIVTLFFDLCGYWFTDSDIIDEDNTDIMRYCTNILSKVKTPIVQCSKIQKELVDRWYIKENEDRESRWFILWFLLYNK